LNPNPYARYWNGGAKPEIHCAPPLGRTGTQPEHAGRYANKNVKNKSTDEGAEKSKSS